MTAWLKEHFVTAGLAAVAVVIALFFAFGVEEDNKESEIEGFPFESSAAADPEKIEESGEETMPVVLKADIKGAVIRPGVYEVFEGERIIDLIDKAGGLSKEADTAGVNFAMKVGDEMAVYIPRKGEVEAGRIYPFTGEGQAGSEGGKINLNTAAAAELETLPGIGPAKSAAIIEHREKEGGFKTIEDMMLISGIGEKTFEKLKDQISVK